MSGPTPAAPAPLRVGVLGAAGRMGRLLVQAIEAAPDLVLSGCFDPRAETGDSGSDLSSRKPETLDAVVEFTQGEAPARLGPEIARVGCAWLSGTTGLTAASKAALASAARDVPVLWAPNLSLGVALLARFLDLAAELLPQSWQLEIVETHHGGKVDAPSGTALALAERWTLRRGGELRHGRTGRVGPRPEREVGLHAVRLPGVAGEHRILLGGAGEGLELVHRAQDRSALVSGSLEALRWLAGRPAGLYTLDDWIEERLHATSPLRDRMEGGESGVSAPGRLPGEPRDRADPTHGSPSGESER